MAQVTSHSGTLPSAEFDKQEHYIHEVLEQLPKTQVLQQFADTYLHSVSWRVMQMYAHTELCEFVKERFAFFQEALREGGKFRIYQPRSNSKTVLEVVHTDRAYLLITLETMIRDVGTRITFKLHPIVGVTVNEDNEPTSVFPGTADNKRISCVYIELDRLGDAELLETLHTRTKLHIDAVRSVGLHKVAIIEKMLELKEPISQISVSLPEPKEEWLDLLDWLINLNFHFLGYIAFPTLEGEKTQPIPDSGLGIFSNEYLQDHGKGLLDILSAHVWRNRENRYPFVMDTIKFASPVQRFENLMRLSLKVAKDGETPVEHMFFGLLRRSSLQVKNRDTPLIHLKMKHIFEVHNMLPDSYDYNEVIRIFSAIPKFELFRTQADDLRRIVEDLLSITDPNEIHCFSYPMPDHKSIRLILVIPPDLFTRTNTARIIEYLKSQAPHCDSEVITVRGVDSCRLHIYFDLLGSDAWRPNPDQMARDIGDLVKSWEGQVRYALNQHYPNGLGEQLYERYLPFMPKHYRARAQPDEVLRDIGFLERLGQEDGIQFDLSPFEAPGSGISGKASLIYIYSRDKIDLINIMPVLQNIGLYVLDQLTARIGGREQTVGYVQTFRVQDSYRKPLDVKRYKVLLHDLLVAFFNGRTENDGLNALTLLSDLDWRAINVLMLYRNLYLQLRASYTRSKINAVLRAHPHHARRLFEFFEAKFSMAPEFGDLDYRKSVLIPRLRQEFLDSLRAVEAVADDVILRRMFQLIDHTLRTNFYIPKSSSDTFISIKLESQQMENMPVPVPYREMYVHDVGMEGTHLRFGPVARGGLRWSDRLDDFRTEILGLVKTQQTKNVVIVPVGSKGGFVVKKKNLTTREEAAAESQKQYRKFISGLLDITDNMDTNRQARHPSHVIPYDNLDPYLVVAADKGTATFSDTANEISEKYGFWLGDGFASGGSIGYDHKKEGITARGAWECVKLHFKEMGKDIQTEATTVIGIGDMAGDVFGNGMLRSKALQLRAAFNHIHIFLDPNPEPEASWEERKRLFELPRSTWKDYNPSLISAGGGVFDRKAKEIALSSQVKTMLGVQDDVLNGEEMVQAILRMRVELFWFGGIGTYIKAATETNLEVGDQANDAVRIDVNECGAQVIGEGANLGLTQVGRIEFDKMGRRLNTDAIDNSAGVNMSDYEVNIKILLQQLLQQGQLASREERNELLRNATDEVAELVLANNRGQHRLLSMDVVRSCQNFRIFKHLVRFLIVEKGLDDRSEYIPTRGELERMEEATEPIPRPILSILQAYVKMWVFNSISASEMLNDTYLEATYREYFPQTLRDRFGEQITHHPLKREIIGTQLTNRMVNQAGCTFFFRLQQLTGKSIPEMAVAYLIFDESLDGAEFRDTVLDAEGVEEQDKYLALLELEGVLQLLTRNLLQVSGKTPSFAMVETYRKLLGTLREHLENSAGLDRDIKAWQACGFAPDFAKKITIMGQCGIAPDVIYLHEQENLEVAEALHLTLQANQIFNFDWLKEATQAIHLESDWELSHQDILLQNIDSHKLQLMRFLIQNHSGNNFSQLSGEALLSPIRQKSGVALTNYFQTIQQLKGGIPINLTSLAVAINRLNLFL